MTHKQITWEEKPTICRLCGGTLEFKGRGEYVCSKCGHMERDDFGKVRHFLEENGPTPAILINEATGVPIDKINAYLKQGRVEIPDGSGVYIKCEKCQTDIRYGRFCPACALKLTKELHGALTAADVGEVPRHKNNMEGKMRFLDKRNSF